MRFPVPAVRIRRLVMVAGGSLWNGFWSLIDDAGLGEDVASTKQAVSIDFRWDLQAPRRNLPPERLDLSRNYLLSSSAVSL